MAATDSVQQAKAQLLYAPLSDVRRPPIKCSGRMPLLVTAVAGLLEA